MSLSRRAVLGGSVGAALAGPSIGSGVKERLFASGMQAQQGASLEQVVDSARAPLAPPPGWDLLRKREDLHWQRTRFRVGNFDPDIYGMQSMSWHAKVNMQIKRDERRQTALDKFREALGGFL